MILLFVHDSYYPSGGAEDLVLIANDLDTVCREIVARNFGGDHAHAFDTVTKEIVARWDGSAYTDSGEWERTEVGLWPEWREQIVDLR